MKRAIEGASVRRGDWSYTLVELLCSIGIVLLLAALLMPALRKGYAKTQRLYCVNNLHQMGLGFHGFAQSHQDRFPMQVSTNDGGVLELSQAGNTMTGEFYFSYRYFLPLSNELVVPKVLNCPSDTRHAATNFADLQNDNLSYFAAGNAEPGNAQSALAGNRNVSPAFGSVARVGGYRYLRWTEELHRFKGNVLFGDGHVDQLNDVFSTTNSGGGTVASLHMPTLKPVAPAPGPSVQYPPFQYVSGSPSGGRVSAMSIPGFTNRFGTNQGVSNFWVTGRHSKGTLLPYGGGEDVAASGVSSPPEASAGPPLGTPARQRAQPVVAHTGPWSVTEMYQEVITKAPIVLRNAAMAVYDIPWYLLLLLLAALLELRRRARAKQRQIVHHPLGRAASASRSGAN